MARVGEGARVDKVNPNPYHRRLRLSASAMARVYEGARVDKGKG